MIMIEENQPTPEPPKAPRKRDLSKIAEQTDNARRHILQEALLSFIGSLLGRPPTVTETQTRGLLVQFSATPLSVYEKDGVRFCWFYVWDRTDAVAFGFNDPNNILDLQIVRVPKDRWPPALQSYVAQQPPEPTTTTA